MDRYTSPLFDYRFGAVWIFECSVLHQLGYGDTENRGGCDASSISSLVSRF